MEKQSNTSNYQQTVQIDIRARRPAQLCPICAMPIGALSGSRDAICKNCGYKDPCCE